MKWQKDDAADAEAICESGPTADDAVLAVKTEEMQAAALLFRARDLLVRQRTQIINALRVHLAEFGVNAAQGRENALKLAKRVDEMAANLAETPHTVLALIVEQLRGLETQVARLDGEIIQRAKENHIAWRLMTIPGIGEAAA